MDARLCIVCGSWNIIAVIHIIAINIHTSLEGRFKYLPSSLCEPQTPLKLLMQIYQLNQGNMSSFSQGFWFASIVNAQSLLSILSTKSPNGPQKSLLPLANPCSSMNKT